MTSEPVLLSRIQFAVTVGFHILWPAYTIGVSGFIAIVSALWLRTGNAVYRALLRFWIHLFALGFAMGVVTGVVMSYQIGTNWSVFIDRTSNVIGPFFTYEVLLAFFLEAGFIGIMLFGMDRVGPRLHFLSCLMVALGAVISAFWILAANSWMQTPAGFAFVNGRFFVTDWREAIFTPSFPWRFGHMVVAAYIAGSFVVMGVSGYYLYRRQQVAFASTSMSIALWVALALVPAQLILGDSHGRNSFRYQPVKVAAMEGDWDTKRGQHLVLFGWPDPANARNDFEIAIPHLGSLILTHDWNGLVPGLTSVPPDERPPVLPVFLAFRLMVGIWVVLFAVTVTGTYLRWRNRLRDSRRFGLLCAACSPLPFLAILSGWTVTEVGRQPYVVYGFLRTADAVSPVATSAVAGSLTVLICLYLTLLLAFSVYAVRTVLGGPDLEEQVKVPASVRPGLDSAPSRTSPRTSQRAR